jgi:hypothetical protein
MRGRFLSAWKIAAIIVFALGIGGYRFNSFNLIFVGILMWFFAGTVANLIFGPKKPKSPQSSSQIEQNQPQFQVQRANVFICQTCGSRFAEDDNFCNECGISLKPAKNV